jgi:uncharacterized protein
MHQAYVGTDILAAVMGLGRWRDRRQAGGAPLRVMYSRGSEEEKLSGKLIPLFGRTLSPNFILADRVQDVEEIRRRLREKDRSSHVLGEIRAIDDFLPGSPELQRRKLAVLARLRTLIDRNSGLLDPTDRAQLLRNRPPDDLHVLGPRDLPASIRRPFTEKDGTVGRVIAYYTQRDLAVWDGRVQIKLADVVQEVRLRDGRAVRSSGWPVIFAAMIRSIRHDGPIVTAASFGGVVLLTLIFCAGRRAMTLVLLTLVAGVLWMVGATAAVHVRINFLNFIALPITFGIGVDYGVNLFLRYHQEGRGRVAAAVAATGAAVALCSLTTIIGYAALLVADNNALRSFGALAILGEVACLAAALLLLPSLLQLRERRATDRREELP